MQILEDIFQNNPPLYPINEFCPEKKALFIDIETTGLKKETTSLYLIGCGYYCGSDFCTKLFFADDESEELEILEAFIGFMKDFTHLFHFNGDKFDIPYLKYKADRYCLGDIFKDITQVDVYGLIKPLRYLLFPDSMRQKAVENFLEITREDMFNGGELIEVYKSYTQNPDDAKLKALITHNREDVLGMHKILPILHYLNLKDNKYTYVSYYINEYNNYAGESLKEVILSYKFDTYIPKSIFAKTETMYVKFSAEEKTLTIRLPLYSGEMKLFFENYRDYCYLPEEDMCIIKTLASSLPRKSYIKATRESCYQRVNGTFIKQPDKIFSPAFKCSCKDKASYFRFPEDFAPELRDLFGRELINVFFHIKKRK